jgi:subtilisin-like proprotein convertase family protein
MFRRVFVRMSMPRPLLSFTVVLAATIASMPVRAQPTVNGIQPARADAVRALDALSVRISSKPVRFRVQDPRAAASLAWRDDVRLTDKTGAVPPPVAGYQLTSRLIVRTERPALLRAFASDYSNLRIEPTRAARGYWTVTAGSVAEAAAIADELADRDGITDVSLDMEQPRSLRSVPDDPLFYQQWHLYNELDPLFDVNAEAAWELGYTGAGVVIGIVEDAWDHEHIDLAPNYFAEASQEGGSITAHATACAGVAGEVAYNDVMGAGMAYGAQLSGQRYGTDLEIAEALAYRNDLNDIKSNSWGPIDDAIIDYMPSIVRSAIEESIATGRGGLGEIFVWAGGNGGAGYDRVDYDPYASSRYTIAVGAIGDQDWRPTYSEKGSSLMLVAQSSGNDRDIATTGRFDSWTTHFGGTSAAAPLVAGVVAVMLEANPALTWRDVQHVLIESARRCDPEHASWITNGGGYDVSYHYGFGAADAGAAVALAEVWENVPHEVSVETIVDVNLPVPDNDPNGVTVAVEIVDNIRVETVELIPQVETPYIGDLEIVLTGPTGTPSLLAQQRVGDPHDNYVDYVFTSLRHWGELAAGEWTVRIADRAAGDLATWIGFRLVIHGTPACPGDLTADGVVSLDDIMVLLEAYGAHEGEPAFDPWADFDNNGYINLSDLAFLLSVFAESCG